MDIKGGNNICAVQFSVYTPGVETKKRERESKVSMRWSQNIQTEPEGERTKKEKREYGVRMSLHEAKAHIEKIIRNGNRKEAPAVFLWGPPGIGKSSIVRQVGKENGFDVIYAPLAQLDSVDLKGFGYVERNNGKASTHWARPWFIPEEGRGILFLDEFNQGSLDVQRAAFQLVLDRRVGEHKLGDGWFVFAAGNRREDNCNVYNLPDALIDRFAHIEVELSVEEWIKWAFQNGIGEEIIAFIKFRPELLLNVQRDRVSLTFPTPRGWEMASRLASQFGWDIITAVHSKCGRGAAAEFRGFLEVYREIPSIEDAIEKGKFTIPSQNSIEWAYLSGIVSRASKPIHFENIAKLILLLADKNEEEFGMFLLKNSYAKNSKAIKATPGWKTIVRHFADLVLD